MPSTDEKYVPSGDLQGDVSPLPDRGTLTGLEGDTYDADLGLDATNGMGSIARDCASDAPDEENVNDDDAGKPE